MMLQRIHLVFFRAWIHSETLHLFQFVILMILCKPLHSVCQATCLVYFNCVCFTVIFLGKIALLSILLQTFSGMHPWWILRLYIVFWLTLECVLYSLKFKVYIFVLRTYSCITGIRASIFPVVYNS